MSVLAAVTLLGLASNSQSLTVQFQHIMQQHQRFRTTDNRRLQSYGKFTDTATRRCLSSSSSSSTASSTTCLYSDFSSHPYSTYYGTSGSTAKQNMEQNDEMADMYGYTGVPPPPGLDDMYLDYYGGVNTHLGSMQEGPPPMMRGMPPPGRPMNKRDFRLGLPPPPGADIGRRNNDMMDRVQERHMLDRLDELLYEHDELRRRLDMIEGRYDDNSSFHMEQTEGFLQGMADEQVRSLRAMMDNVLGELKNVQQTLQVVQLEQQRTAGYNRSPSMDSSSAFGGYGVPHASPPPSQSSPSPMSPQAYASTASSSRSPSPYPSTQQGYQQQQQPPQQAQQQYPPPPPPPPQSPQQQQQPRTQASSTPPPQMKTGMGAEHSNPQYGGGMTDATMPPPSPQEPTSPRNAMNSFQQRSAGMKEPPRPPPRSTEPRKSLLRERIYEQKGRGDNEVPYPGYNSSSPPPPNVQGGGGGGGPLPRSPNLQALSGGSTSAFQPQSQSYSSQPRQSQRGPPINGGYASNVPPPGYFDHEGLVGDNDDGGEEEEDDLFFPKGGVNTFEPGQGLGQQQRKYERAAGRNAASGSTTTRSNSFGQFGGNTSGRGRMSGFGGNNNMGMGGRAGSRGSGRNFGEESGSMTFTDGPDGGRCFLT